MCKHILFNNFNKNTDLETLKVFTQKTYDRDGFGAIIRRQDGSIDTLKSLDIGYFYISLMELIGENTDTLIVHHRTSTNGHGVDYAHPFEFQGHYLTHNGVVTVPEKHNTLTTNDSESLLHHLIKNNYDTKSIQGYFSVFIVTQNDTRVIVDNTAPLYSDGRIYCSHRLFDHYEPIALKHIRIVNGETDSVNPIEVQKSDYGMSFYSKSIGFKDDPMESIHFADSDNVSDFLYAINPSDDLEIMESRSKSDMILAIKNKAYFFGIDLTDDEVNEVYEYFIESNQYNSRY